MHCRVWVDGPLHQRVEEVNPVEALKRDIYVNSKGRTIIHQGGSNTKNRRQDLHYADVEISTKTKTFMAHKAVLISTFRTIYAEGCLHILYIWMYFVDFVHFYTCRPQFCRFLIHFVPFCSLVEFWCTLLEILRVSIHTQLSFVDYTIL